MRRYSLQVLLLVNVALVCVLIWLWVLPDRSLRNVHWRQPEAIKTDLAKMLPILPGVGSADTSQFIAMLDRPLFAITRRPPPPPPPPQAPPPTDNLSTARLTGVYQGEGGSGVIIFIAGKDRRLRLNEAIEGWMLQNVAGRDVTFARGGQRRVLTLPRAALTAENDQSKLPSGVARPAPGPSNASRNSRPAPSSTSSSVSGVTVERAIPPAAPPSPVPSASPPQPLPKATFGGGRR